MKNKLHFYISIIFSFFFILSFSQDRKKIRVTAPYYDKNEIEFPGATILTRNSAKQIYIEHEGIEMWCDKAFHYSKEDSISAFGNVIIKQGDTITLTSKVANYSGTTQLAFCAGDVLLREPKSTLKTDTLNFNRLTQQAYYKSGGVVHHEENIIKSNVGRYFVESQKYQFVSEVDINNPNYNLKSAQLDFYSNSGLAYIYGKSTIKHKGSTILCERGFYDTNNDLGHFEKNTKIYYKNRILEGDSIYFNQKTNFASATNNIKVTDTTNHSVITGHYAEIFKAKDSVFITKRALARTLQGKDSIYIHADRLMVTGKPDNRIIRGYKNAKLYKLDINGKCDSIHINQKTGITKLIRNPILWSGDSQMTGDTIQLFNSLKSNKLDSLRVFHNTFLIQKDSIEGFNQVKGKELSGLFNDKNELYSVDINKNTEHLQYTRKDNGEMIGINKVLSSKINIIFEANQMNEITYIGSPEGDLTPDSQYPKNARKLRGFEWRGDERILSIEDLFKDDPPLNLPIIKGIDARIFDDIDKTELLENSTLKEKIEDTPKIISP